MENKIFEDYSNKLNIAIENTNNVNRRLTNALIAAFISITIIVSVAVIAYFTTDYDIPSVEQEQGDDYQRQEID